MVIVAEGVRRQYGEIVALAGVSLEVDEGEVFGLVGPNGAGKTTLVRALTGTTRAAGRVELFGGHPREAEPSRVGLLPQAFDPPERLTARELVGYYGGLYDEPRGIPAVLDDVGLGDAADTRYGNLSGGQRRRTCLGTALVNDPDVLFLDEPTTGIDPAGRRAVWRLLENLADAGTTVFLTTHDMDEAERLADRVGLLDEGSLVAVGAPGELVTEHGGPSSLAVDAPDEEAAARALERSGYRLQPRRRTLTVADVEAADVGDVVGVLEDAGVEYTAVVWRQPTLEDAYLRLAGARGTESGEPSDERQSVVGQHAVGERQ